ncbi:MAG: type II secretion system F family protein [Oscillospiraceae bacterium]|jgi:type IV pilus assembly protein PilC|nr:type II secretion system F family protein [Oscillospiraceae bacterium]
MPFYAYTAANSTGKIVNGRERADSPDNLKEKLRERGIFVAKYEETMVGATKKAKYKFKTKKLSLLCRQIASMLEAGVTLVRVMGILVTQEEDKRAQGVLKEMYEEIQRGNSFSDTLTSRPGVFPDLFVSMVIAGEAAGNLDIIMARVSDHYAKENKLNNKIKGAMIYPIILGVLMVGVVLVLFTFVLPMFIDMLPSEDEIAPLTKILLNISDFLTSKWYILIAVIVGLVIGSKAALTVPVVRLGWDRILCKFPKVGPLLMTIYTARFARTMSNLFASGLQIVECLEKAIWVCGNAFLIDRFRHIVDEVKRGESMSEAIVRENLFENIFTSMILIGEESGRLDEMLQKSADYYDEESDSAISRLVSMMEPLMIIVMGIAVGFVLAGIFPLMYGSFAGIADS